MDYEGLEANYIAGTPYLGASVRMYPGPGGYQGELMAWDVKNARKVWGVKDEKFPVYSGVLATAGDVVFYGTMEGWFRAVDAAPEKSSGSSRPLRASSGIRLPISGLTGNNMSLSIGDRRVDGRRRLFRRSQPMMIMPPSAWSAR